MVVVDIRFINDGDVDRRAVLADNSLAVVLLNGAGFLYDTVVRVAEMFGKERFPFVVGKPYVVKPFHLTAEIGNEVGLACDIDALVSLAFELTDKVSLHLSLTLILSLATIARFELGYDGRFRVFRHQPIGTWL